MDWNKLLSNSRLNLAQKESPQIARSDFQRDFDRIVFSSAFRRLQDKTQVFPLSESDYIRTRLTHSIETSCVGRSLGTLVGDKIIKKHSLKRGKSEIGSIVAAACLAHDIGNPPFGHTGENAIQHWFRSSKYGQFVIQEIKDSKKKNDFINFEGNAQGFRILTKLQSPDNPGGLQLTCATLGAFIKYPFSSSNIKSKFGFFSDDEDLFKIVAREVGLIRKGKSKWCRHPLAFLVEAADDICYHVVDVEDGFRLGYISFDEVQDLLLKIIRNQGIAKDVDRIKGDKEKIEFLRGKCIDRIINDVAECFMKNEDAILNGVFNDGLTKHIECYREFQELKNVAKQKAYSARNVIEIEAAGFNVLGELLEHFLIAVDEFATSKEPSFKSKTIFKLIPNQFIGPERQPDKDRYKRTLKITDYVSGMTDSFAVSYYKKLTGITLPQG